MKGVHLAHHGRKMQQGQIKGARAAPLVKSFVFPRIIEVLQSHNREIALEGKPLLFKQLAT